MMVYEKLYLLHEIFGCASEPIILSEIKENISNDQKPILVGTNEIYKKLKLSHYTPRRRKGEKRYSSCSFSTSALRGGEWSV
jgi:hypothetical protein